MLGMNYEMWVLPVSKLLEMEGPPLHHQQLIEASACWALELASLEALTHLGQANLLVRWCPGMVVTFVSHQWLHSKHPDPALTSVCGGEVELNS